MANKAASVAGFALFCIGVVLVLGGLSAATDSKQKYCEKLKNSFADDPDLGAMFSYNCEKNVREQNRFYWFTWALEVVTLVGVPVCIFGSPTIQRSIRVGLIALLAIVGTLCIIGSNNLYTQSGSYKFDGEEDGVTNLPDGHLVRVRVALSGFALSALATILLAFAFGSEVETESGGQYKV